MFGLSAGAAAALAGGMVVGSVISANGAKSAAQTQANAANAANQTQRDQYAQTMGMQAPYRTAGTNALNALSQYYGLPGVNADGSQSTGPAPDQQQVLQNQPGYQFQQQQGDKAVQQNLAARGLLQSGAAGKELTQFGQGLASSYGQQYVGGLANLAGLGQTATQSTAAAGQNSANNISANQIYAGNAMAQGQIGSANAIANGLQGLAGVYGNYSNGQYIRDQLGNGQANQQASSYINGYQTPQFDTSLKNPYQNQYGYMSPVGP